MLIQLHNCESQLLSRAFDNDNVQDQTTPFSKNTSLYQYELIKAKRKLKQKSALSSELFRICPENKGYTQKEPQHYELQARKPFFELHQVDTNARENAEKLRLEGRDIHLQYQYALKIPVQLNYENGIEQEGEQNLTGEIMDNKFNQLLQQNCGNGQDMKLEIQSKFSFVKSQKVAKEIVFFQPDQDREMQQNTHEKLLQEENHYLRQELMHYTECFEAEKSRFEETNRKNRGLRKENTRLKEVVEELNHVKSCLEQQIFQKDELIQKITGQLQEHTNISAQLAKNKLILEDRCQILEKEQLSWEQKLQIYESSKDREIQLIQEERAKLKQSYVEHLCEKEKEVAELQEYVDQLKAKIAHFQKDQVKDKRSVTHSFKQDMVDEEVFSEVTNSICLSLAEAESLKNIIEQTEEAHRAEITMLKQSHSQMEQSLKKELQELQEKVSKVQPRNESNPTQEGKNRFSAQKYQALLSNFTEQPPSLQNIREMKEEIDDELQNLSYCRRIKTLQKHLLEEREAKMNLIGKITSLSQQNISAENQQDQQMEQLLEKCVDELQKQRQFNLMLTNENKYLRKALSKHQSHPRVKKNNYN